MRRFLLLVFALYIVVGCGGSGSTPAGAAPDIKTRDSVKEGVAHSLMGMAQAGMGGTVSSSTGGSGGFGFPMIGSFLFQFLPPAGGPPPSPAMAVRPNGVSRIAEPIGTSTGGTDGGMDGGGGGDPEFYYDDYLGLWVDMESTETSYTTHLYIDEGKTQPAGSFESTFPAGWDTYPYALNSTFEISAGNLAGAHGNYSVVIESEEKGHSTFESVWPNVSSDSGESAWDGSASSWTYESHAGEQWWKGTGSFSANGSGKSAFSDSAGYKATYSYRADGSGSGLVEGPDPGLPARITWSATGHIKIVYADGSVEEWDPSDYYGTGTVDGGEGTSGGGDTGGSGGASTGRPGRRK